MGVRHVATCRNSCQMQLAFQYYCEPGRVNTAPAKIRLSQIRGGAQNRHAKLWWIYGFAWRRDFTPILTNVPSRADLILGSSFPCAFISSRFRLAVSPRREVRILCNLGRAPRFVGVLITLIISCFGCPCMIFISPGCKWFNYERPSRWEA